MILLISADLNSTSKVYDGFFATIKSEPLFWHYLEHVWLVKTDDNSQTWLTKLRPHINEPTDFLFIVKIDGKEFEGWLPPKAFEWIRENRDSDDAIQPNPITTP